MRKHNTIQLHFLPVDDDFCALTDGNVINVQPTCTIADLRQHIADVTEIGGVKIKADSLTLWKPQTRLADPNHWATYYKELLEDACGNPSSVTKLLPIFKVSDYFPKSLPTPSIHLIVEVPIAGTHEAKHALLDVAHIFEDFGLPDIDPNIIIIHVRRHNSWTDVDVRNPRNHINLLWEYDSSNRTLVEAKRKLDRVRKKLDKRRILSDRTLRDSLEYKVIKAKANNHQIFDERGGINVVSGREIDAHNHAIANYLNWAGTVQDLSSYMKDGWFTSALVAPPMFDVVKSNKTCIFNSGVGWKFTILVAADRVQASPNLRAPKTEYRKYSPSPDFMLVPSCNVSKDKGEGVGFCPILLGEVISNRKESDRWRMLLQLAVCARVNGVIAGASRSPLVVQAVYLTDDYVAERYLAYADIGKLTDSKKFPSVYITKDVFEVATLDGATKFLRSMYNFKDVVMDAENMWNAGKEGLCTELHKALDASDILAMTSRSRASKSRKRTDSSISRLAVPLGRQGYTIYKYSTTHKHIAYATALEGNVVLKCINNSRTSEVQMLEHLHRASTSDTRIIPFTVVLSTQSDTVICMPHHRPLNKCGTFNVDMAANFGRQLLGAVQFMHVQGVAHRDIKPENVVVDCDMHRLFFIDYDLAIFVEGRDEVRHGFVGTDGFTAPEVGDDLKDRYYSPIAADLWATGSVLEFLLSRSKDPDSPKLKPLWLISRLLLDDDPAQRPGADQALAMLLQDVTAAIPRPAPGVTHPTPPKRPGDSPMFTSSKIRQLKLEQTLPQYTQVH